MNLNFPPKKEEQEVIVIDDSSDKPNDADDTEDGQEVIVIDDSSDEGKEMKLPPKSYKTKIKECLDSDEEGFKTFLTRGTTPRPSSRSSADTKA